MTALCKIGLHRWKDFGVAGLFALPVSQCKRCGTGKIHDFMAGSRKVPPEVMARIEEKRDG